MAPNWLIDRNTIGALAVPPLLMVIPPEVYVPSAIKTVSPGLTKFAAC